MEKERLKWHKPSANGLDVPFMPPDKYISMQNPPNFTWAYAHHGSHYELVVAKDKELKNICYSKDNIETNFFNFEYTFEKGVIYYWSVRFVTKDGNLSEWSKPNRFMIHPDAMEFTVPHIDSLLKRIPESHPRILTTPETLNKVRSYKDVSRVSKEIYDFYIEKAENILKEVSEGVYDFEEPRYEAPRIAVVDGNVDPEAGLYAQKFRRRANKCAEDARVCAFAYLMSGDRRYGEFSVKALRKLSTWCMKEDAEGNLIYDENGETSYENQDQVHREISYRAAMAYDWVYDLLSDSDRKAVLNMLSQRIKRMAYLLDSLKTTSYDSHGWTTFGYIGIIGVALYGEVPDAYDWLKVIIPTYTSFMPCWGYQDGGWSQGTDYWQYSTVFTQEFVNVLSQGDIVNLYEEAWMQNEYLWTLYAYPPRSFGTFGDQSNRVHPAEYSITSLSNEAYFTKNPCTKWLVENFRMDYPKCLDSYFGGMLEDIEAKAPLDYPLSHHFKDIGWVVMTNSLTDDDRIHMTFKSSSFGSFNHSHPDQNSFIIQAYGENLAIKGGYYDAYHTIHDNNITRPTFSHNCVTVDGGKGQRDDDFSAKGKILGFVNHKDFDCVTGDASSAYIGPEGLENDPWYGYLAKGIGSLEKFERSIIYIRPDVFVVIDDLKADEGTKSSFEWWLNAEHDIEYTDKSAILKEGKANLKTDIVCPSGTKANYYGDFTSPFDGKHYPPGARYKGANEQRKVAFVTEKTESTRFVAVMSVYKDGAKPADYEATYAPDKSYVKLMFAGGTQCIVNLTEGKVDAEGIVFDGSAVTLNDNSIMLTMGSQLTINDKKIVDSVRKLSIATGRGEISVSTNDDSDNYLENRLTIANGTKYLTVRELKDKNGRNPDAIINLPHTMINDECVELYPYKGEYKLRG